MDIATVELIGAIKALGVTGLCIGAVIVLYRDGKAAAKEMNERFIATIKELQANNNGAIKQQRDDFAEAMRDTEAAHTKQIELIKK